MFIVVIVGAVLGILINFLADFLPGLRESIPACANCGETKDIWEYIFNTKCSKCQQKFPDDSFLQKISYLKWTPKCEKCDYIFTPRNYLFSFRCPNCGKKTRVGNWLVPLVSIVVSVLLALFPARPLTFWASLPLFAFFGLVMLIDFRYKAVLLETDILGILLGIIYGLVIHSPSEMIFGGIAGAAIMLLIYLGGILFNRVLGNIRHQKIDEVALGLGDVIVSSYLGLIMGWPHIVGMLVIGILLGGVFALLYILFKLVKKSYVAYEAIPYVPFLVIAAIVMFYLP
jgi:prepilin signal peptidase PulO-like enzyme (type II secretory pathway)